MNKRLVKLFAGTALSAAAMFGSTVTVALGPSPFPNGGDAPYQGYINGSSVASTIVCDDDTGDYVDPNETWTANETSLATIIAADKGNPATPTTGLRFSPAATSLYEEVAWLALQFSSNPTDTGAIQTAVWDVFNLSGTTQMGDSLAWLAKAELSSNYNGSAVNSMASKIFFLTPIDGSQNPVYDGNPQEFILISGTPEPATYTLFGAGLMLISVGTFRRTKNSKK